MICRNSRHEQIVPSSGYDIYVLSRKQEEKDLKTTGGRDPDVTFKNPGESKGGVFKTYIRVRSPAII